MSLHTNRRFRRGRERLGEPQETQGLGTVGTSKVRITRAMDEVNGLNMFYLRTHSGGTPMLCLHGRWGRGQTWIDLMLRYGDRYGVTAPDQRGHGLTDKPVARYASDDLAADARALLQHLECGPAVLVGHSMGGRVAAHVAARFPDSVMALAILDESAAGPETMSDLPPNPVPHDDKLTTDWPTPYPTLAEARRHLAECFPRQTNQAYFEESLVETPEGYDFLFSRRAMAALAVYDREWFDILPLVKCPVLLVRARESWCLSAEDAARMQDALKHCTYFEVSDSDHRVYADHPEEFYAGLDAFLAGL